MKKNLYKFVIPVKPDSINKVCQYGKKDGDLVKMKHKWEDIARIYIRKAKDDQTLPEHFNGKIGIHFKLFFELERQRDGDNYTLMCKGILDAFVMEKMIEDDNYTHVVDIGRRFEIDRDRSRVEVHITEKVEGINSLNEIYGKPRKIQRDGDKHSALLGCHNYLRNEGNLDRLATKNGADSNASESAEASSHTNDGGTGDQS